MNIKKFINKHLKVFEKKHGIALGFQIIDYNEKWLYYKIKSLDYILIVNNGIIKEII